MCRKSGFFAFWMLLIILVVSTAGLLFSSCGLNFSSGVKLRVLVVHSYHETWGWNQDISKGIIEGLAREGCFRVYDPVSSLFLVFIFRCRLPFIT